MHELNIAKMTKVHDELTDLQFNSRSLLLTAFWVSRWPQMQMMQWNEMMYMSRRRFWYIIRPKRSYGCKVTGPRTEQHGSKSRDLEKSEGGLGFTVHARIWIWARRGTEAEAAPAAELELAGAAGCAGAASASAPRSRSGSGRVNSKP